MLYGISAVFDQMPFSNDAVLDALDVHLTPADGLPRELRTDRRVRADLANASLPSLDLTNGDFAGRLVYG